MIDIFFNLCFCLFVYLKIFISSKLFFVLCFVFFIMQLCLIFSWYQQNQLFMPHTFSLHYPIISIYRSISPFPEFLSFLSLLKQPPGYQLPLMPIVFHFFPHSSPFSPSSFCPIISSIRIYTTTGSKHRKYLAETDNI